jgi:DNA polymerase-3 subunit gamma/tau
MSYTALYRKYRPQTFSDVKGQDHIVTTLQNQIKTGRIGHAYLMCGTRGTGKTTLARIFAKAVNCQEPVEGNPCDVCELCTSINEGSSLNVIEIDAASNNGVDNIRRIREEVAYRPTEGKYKVYIIDEVHMLSARGAFPALLKTLEEPPPYVIFVLATTEKHGIPVTILSRCQQYDLKRMKVETIAGRIEELLASEGVVAQERGILYISKMADGSMRDALSLLDQCIAFNMGEDLTYDKVLKVLGAVDIEVFSKLLKGILAEDVALVMELIEEIIINGSELSQLVSDFTWHLRNLLLLKTSDNIKGDLSSSQVEETLETTSENIKILKEESKLIGLETLLRFIRITGELSQQLRFTTQKRVTVEVAFIKLCIPSMETNVDSLIERIRVLEERVEAGVLGRARTLGGSGSLGQTLDGEESGLNYSGSTDLGKELDTINGDRGLNSELDELREDRSLEKESGEERSLGEKSDVSREDKGLKRELEDKLEKSARSPELEKESDEIGEDKGYKEQLDETSISTDIEESLSQIIPKVPRLIVSLSPLLRAYFSNTSQYKVVAESGNVLKIYHSKEEACNLLNSPEKKEQLEKLIKKQTGEEVEVKATQYEVKKEGKSQGVEEIVKEKIRFPITQV